MIIRLKSFASYNRGGLTEPGLNKSKAQNRVSEVWEGVRVGSEGFQLG